VIEMHDLAFWGPLVAVVIVVVDFLAVLGVW